MTRFIASPNLPQGPVTLALLGERYRNTLESVLEGQGTAVIWLPDNPFVDPRLSGHADLSALHLGGNRLMLASYLKGNEIVEKLTIRGFEIIFAEKGQTATYPGDCGLNVCLIGKHILFNSATANPEICHYVNHLESIRVRQGYTKCAVCVVDENSIITSDKGVYDAAVDSGLSALPVDSGFVRLPGYPEGFIGGSAFKLSSDTLAFTGSLAHCPYKDDVEAFLHDRKIKMITLTPEPVFDIGSAVLLMEEAA